MKVGFKIAKLAHKKGYNKKTKYCYVVKHDENSSFIDLCKTKSVVIDVGNFVCYDPSQKKLKKWLFKKHGISIDIEHNLYSDDYSYVITYRDNSSESEIEKYDTKEDAINRGLSIALRRLKDKINISI